jgi:uncharacterized protein YndB with AHSA1/START domain
LQTGSEGLSPRCRCRPCRWTSERRAIYWKGEYLEVVEPERLVFTVSDQPGKAYELVTVVFTELADGRTEMLFRQQGRMSAEQYKRTGEGWSSFFDRIAQRLAVT